MIRLRETLLALRRSERGVAALEFCIVLPVLLLLLLGTFDVSRLIARRVDLQQAVTETVGLAIAQPPQDGQNLAYLQNAAAAAAGVPASNVTVVRQARCNNVVANTLACPNQSQFALYVSITISGTYTPNWRHFGVSATVPMVVSRTLRIR